ncbi:hypothetical protein MUK42_30833 [Musa troglodytarum]|uniref:Uncharacterized protein n=1 Tax=Musa troglodytarum TaxID=320322 RepID=A0A9E7FG27_9LILI|nr:hypothetical protein MUK42_30833 [Musa troglodytarum]
MAQVACTPCTGDRRRRRDQVVSSGFCRDRRPSRHQDLRSGTTRSACMLEEQRLEERWDGSRLPSPKVFSFTPSPSISFLLH